MIGELKKKRLQLLIEEQFENGTSERELSDWYIEEGLENKMSLYEFPRGELLKIAREVIEVRKNTKAEMIKWANKSNKEIRTKFKGYEYIDKDFIESHHIEQGMSVKEIANLCDCSVEFIYKKMREYKITPVSTKKGQAHNKKIIDKEVLQKYVDSGFTMKEIAEKLCCGTSTIRIKIKSYGIELKDHKRKRRVNIAKETLEGFISNGYTIKKMEKELGYSYTTIRLALNEYSLSV